MTDVPPLILKIDGTGGARLDVRKWPGVQPRAFLLLHGPASEARLWDTVAERLAVRGHPVYAMRGSGAEHGAAEVAAAAAALGLSGVVVAARSSGADAALRLAAENPELVAGLALVDPAPGPDLAGPGEVLVPWRTLLHAERPDRLAGDLIELAGEARDLVLV